MMQYPAPAVANPAARQHVHAGSGSDGLWFIRDDFYVNYTSVLRHVPAALQMARSAVESNRCFFLHLGIALNIHPFALQVACRHLASQLLLDTGCEDYSLRADILPSVLGYAHFVDANALIWLWLQEFGPYRICLLSGTSRQPIVSLFRTRGAPLHKLSDVIVHCDGSHFTLLRAFAASADGGVNPLGGEQAQTSSVPALIQMVKARGGLVQDHELEVRSGHSVWAVMDKIFK